MKKFVQSGYQYRNLSLMILLLLTVLVLSGCSEKHDTELIEFGTLNLSDWVPKDDVTVRLNGEWELYPGKLIEPGEFDDYKSDKIYFNVPNPYTKGAHGETLEKEGVATLRLVIKMPKTAPDTKVYGLIVRQVMTASKVWINGVVYSEVGVVTQDPEAFKGSFERQVITFKQELPELEIVIQAANYHNIVAKIRDIQLGTALAVKHHYMHSVSSDIFITGALAIMAAYHFALFFKRPSYKAPLYFGFFCLIIALRNVMVGGRFVYEIFPNITIEQLNRTAFLTVYGGLPFIVSFFRTLFPRKIPARLLHILVVMTLVASSLTLFTPIVIYSRLLILYEVVFAAIFLYLLYAIFYEITQKTQGATILFVGVLVYVGATFNDMLLQEGIIQTRSLASIGFFIFIFSQAYIMAIQFSDAFDKVDKLMEENKAVYRDDLTGLLNRKGYYEKAEAVLKEARGSKRSFAIIYGDLNRFKQVNDNYGHKEGDKALIMTASLLVEGSHKSDVVARLSGDEFIILSTELRTDAAVLNRIDHISNLFDNYNIKSIKPYQLSISMGYALYDADANQSLDMLMLVADKGLYVQKESFAKASDRRIK